MVIIIVIVIIIVLIIIVIVIASRSHSPFREWKKLLFASFPEKRNTCFQCSRKLLSASSPEWTTYHLSHAILKYLCISRWRCVLFCGRILNFKTNVHNARFWYCNWKCLLTLKMQSRSKLQNKRLQFYFCVESKRATWIEMKQCNNTQTQRRQQLEQWALTRVADTQQPTACNYQHICQRRASYTTTATTTTTTYNSCCKLTGALTPSLLPLRLLLLLLLCLLLGLQ